MGTRFTQPRDHSFADPSKSVLCDLMKNVIMRDVGLMLRLLLRFSMGNGSDRSDPSNQADRSEILTRPYFLQFSGVGQVLLVVSGLQVKNLDPSG